MKRALLKSAVFLCLAIAPLESHAGILTTTALGTSIGILAGSVAMALANDPGDHYNYPAIGAGIGCAAGLALGLSGAIGSGDSKALTLNYYQNSSYREKIYGLVFLLPFH